MVRSMTGYGAFKIERLGKIISVEIKSLNSKFLDLSFRTPSINPIQDLWIRSECNQNLVRGKVSISITIEESKSESSQTKTNFIDLPLLNSYIEVLRPLAQKTGGSENNLLSDCLHLPGIIKNMEEAPNEEFWQLIQSAFIACTKNFNEFRLREGKVIEEEFTSRTALILENLVLVEEMGPKRMEIIKIRLENSLKDLKSGLDFDSNRFEQELIYYLDKMDFSEEISRLRTHCNYFLECLKSENPNGKKLGFVVQEMGREINTLGSKANDAAIQHKVVGMKEELEKMKEQIANIL